MLLIATMKNFSPTDPQIAELHKRISMATEQGVPPGSHRGSIIQSAINGNVLGDILKSL